MHNVSTRVIALLLQLILFAIAVHLARVLITRFFSTRIRRFRQLSRIEFLPFRAELPSPQKTD